MAAITKGASPSLASILVQAANKITGLVAGEAIAIMDACYVKSDGKIWKSTGAAATAPAKVRGFAMTAAAVGEACTLIHDVVVQYGSGFTPGADVFLSGATAGLIVDAASTGGTAPIGYVVDATRIYLGQSHY